MKNILYFILLVVVFGSLSLFAIEQREEKKIGSVHKNENVGARKQDLLSSTNQKDELKSNVDAKQTQEAESKRLDGTTDKEKLQHNENKASVVEKTISEGEKIDKDLPNDQLEGSTDKFAQNLPNMANKEVNKDLKPEPLPLSADLNENTTDPQKNLQADQKIDIKDNELSKSDASQLLEEKKEKVENQSEEKKVKETNSNSKDRNRVKPITKKDESEKKNLQKWTKLNREPIKEWGHKDIQSKSIYKRQYDSLNEHLPTTVFIDDYSKQFFYCIKKNNLTCLRGVISKLEKIGLTIQEILRFRNKLGDTPLIYSVKQGEVDIVRFLLLQGADLRVVNNNFQSPIDIAIEKKQINIINAIAEMMPHLLEDRKIDNKESSAMYDWAVKTKENNESQCDKQDD
ncbi:ankyrin repeat domain-containing protein [Wolbachia endosymbiont (group A) of Yponomeuta plumbellus]|uniref:ankyrin repeat domain-containing protein n=1 Tax=Wolbachia endosymbiont (group A) of Yponomeuta plumbellus TaxID=2954068 RepID=UPI00222ED86D|nr:ankyrin repeat domain-containing protein [Wolbachia endosymbiont (group A) of Yponomeuta plumbellus]